MKKQNKTFAQRARDIESKFKRAEFDGIEKSDMEAEFEALMSEQEAVREMMGMNQQSQPVQQFAYGGRPEDGSILPIDFAIKSAMSINKMYGNNNTPPVDTTDSFAPVRELLYRTNNNSLTSNPNYASFHSTGRLGEVPDTKTLASMKTLTPEQIKTMEQQAKEAEVTGGGDFWNNNKQYAPYAIAGASNIASNLLLASMAKKNQQRVNPILSTPEKMNMEVIAEKLRKDAGVSKNIGMKNARDLGTNAGSSLANMGVMGSAVDRQLAGNLTDLYGQQEQYNVGTANQFALQNQDAGNRANMMNAQLGQQANQDQLGYLSGALGTIPGVMKDIRMDKADSQMRDVMDRYYQSIGGRNYATVGSIFKDPKSGFKYKVKPDLTLEQVKE